MPSSPRRPTVLLVEDSEDDAFFFRLSLRKAGLDCDLIQLTDGAAAITYLEGAADAKAVGRIRPDLVFLDLKISAFSGFEVLNWIQEQSFQPPLDVAILSGSEHPGDIERASALGASAYIVKPVQRAQLATRFAAWQQRQAAPPMQARSGKSLCDAPQRTA